jgi:catalase
LGINHTQLPVNAPHAVEARNYGRDGAMAGHTNGGRAKNYEPNSFDGPVQTDQPYAAPLDTNGGSGTYSWDERDTDNFAQAGDLYRLQAPDAQQRLVDNIAGGLAQISAGPVGEGIIERSIAHFGSADPEFGDRVAQGVKERRG